MIPHSLCPFKLWRHNEDEIHEFIFSLVKKIEDPIPFIFKELLLAWFAIHSMKDAWHAEYEETASS